MSSKITLLRRKAICACMPRNWLLKSTLRNGAVVVGENRGGFGGRGIFVYRDELEPELDLLEDFLMPGDVFLDVGANVGAFSMKAAKIVGQQGLVVSVEPTPFMAGRLHSTMMENKFSNMRIRLACASDKVGFAEFWMNKDKPNSFSLLREKGSSAFSTFTLTLDWLAEIEGLQKIDYIKIDAEGAEEMILEGASETIKKFRPVIQVEITISNPKSIAENYKIWRESSDSLNCMFIPEESPLNKVVEAKGWFCS